jgi:hypothetical protein
VNTLKAIFLAVVCFVFFGSISLADQVRERVARRKKPVDIQIFLRAIRQVESGDNALAIGPVGERSAYQFTRATWERHSSSPFERATHDPLLAELVAQRFLRTIRWKLQQRRLAESVENFAAAWHWGEGFESKRSESNYAERVSNLYWDATRAVEDAE